MTPSVEEKSCRNNTESVREKPGSPDFELEVLVGTHDTYVCVCVTLCLCAQAHVNLFPSCVH